MSTDLLFIFSSIFAPPLPVPHWRLPGLFHGIGLRFVFSFCPLDLFLAPVPFPCVSPPWNTEPPRGLFSFPWPFSFRKSSFPPFLCHISSESFFFSTNFLGFHLTMVGKPRPKFPPPQRWPSFFSSPFSPTVLRLCPGIPTTTPNESVGQPFSRTPIPFPLLSPLLRDGILPASVCF